MRKKAYTIIYTVGALMILIGGGFIYSYYPSKLVREGMGFYEAKQKTIMVMGFFGFIVVVLYYILKLTGINKWYTYNDKRGKGEYTDSNTANSNIDSKENSSEE